MGKKIDQRSSIVDIIIMSMIWQIVYYIMWSEIIAVVMICLPLPTWVQKPVIKSISESSLVKQLRTAIIFVIFALSLLFYDAYRTSAKLRSKKASLFEDEAKICLSRDDADRFRAERNMYICGLTLILALVLHVMQGLIIQLGTAQTELDTLRKMADNNKKGQAMLDEAKAAELQSLKAELRAAKLGDGASTNGGLDTEEDAGNRNVVGDKKEGEKADNSSSRVKELMSEVEDLRKDNKTKTADVRAMTSQAESMSREVDRLRDENERLARQLDREGSRESKKDK